MDTANDATTNPNLTTGDLPLPTRQWLNVRDVSAMTGICTGTLSMMARRGRGPTRYKFAKFTVRYRVEDVEAWIAESKQG